MKRIVLFFSLLLVSFILISCNINESKLIDELNITFNQGDNLNHVTNDITLTTTTSNIDAIVVWESDNNEVITISSNKGLVYRQKEDVIVTLTVSITVNNIIYNKDFILTVIKAETNLVIVTFNGDNNSPLETININKESTVEKPSEPIKAGYTFIGWYLNDSLFDFDILITENITLVAKYQKSLFEQEIYKFDFGTSRISGYDSLSFTFSNTDGTNYTLNKQRSQIYDSQTQPHTDQAGMLVMAPTNTSQVAFTEFDFSAINNLSKVEFKFAAWNQAALNRLSSFSDATLALQIFQDDTWISIKDTNNNDNLFTYITDNNLVYRFITFENLQPAKYRLYYNAPSATTGNTSQSIVIDDLSVYGLFEVAGGNIVTFNYNYNNAPTNSISVVETGMLVTEAFVPIRLGYDFIGWYINDQEFDFDTPITNDITLTAKWIQSKIVVTFDYGLATLEPSIQLIDTNTKATKILDPQRDGYTFIGWYQTIQNNPINVLYDFNTNLGDNIRLYAKWENNDITELQRNDNLLDEYYNSIKGLANGDLLLGLRSLITTTHTSLISYDEARYILNVADKTLYNDDLVVGIYHRESIRATWDGISWHREHVWPNSKLGKPRVEGSDKDQASDLHNLRAINQSVNSSRSNRYFSNTTLSSPLGHTIGNNAYYPGDEDMGDVARILMYMAIRYDFLKLTNNESLLILGDYTMSNTFMGELDVLYNWHLEDPVDEFEIHRNEVIFNNQGNRNPFIDQPELFKEAFEYFVELDSITLSSKNETMSNIEVTILINYSELMKKEEYLIFV